MTTVYVAMEDSIAVLRQAQGRWQLASQFEGHGHLECIAADPRHAGRLYCGTDEQGLWRTDDGGETWQPVGYGIRNPMVMAVAVSSIERVGDYGVVWAGTELTALFRSEDGGDTWTECEALLDLPSKPTWKFPPRPGTHHVRWIQPDPVEPERVFVAIEQGGVMRSLDRGRTWEDRKPDAQLDCHSLAMHPDAPGRAYEAAGGSDAKFQPVLHMGWPPVRGKVTMHSGGYAETYDGGATWQVKEDGLEGHHYLWSVAVDPADPDTIIASAAVGPFQAHHTGQTESYIIRRSAGTAWQVVRDGLPPAAGLSISVLGTTPAEAHVFYAANNLGVFRSADGGASWQRLAVSWPERFEQQHVGGIAVLP